MGEPFLGGLATHSDRGADHSPWDARLPGVAHFVVKGCLGSLLVARRGRDGVHQHDPVFAQHTPRSHHTVKTSLTEWSGRSHDRIEEKILADAIIDRITTNAHATVLTCDDFMRKHFTQLE